MTPDPEDREFDIEEHDESAEQDLPHEMESESDSEDDRGDGRRGRGRRERRPRLDSFEKMKVWQEAHRLTLKVFEMTPGLPAEQQEGLALQMEQAAVNVPKSIAEGFKRRGPRNKAHFYNVAQSSLEGLRYYFILCRDLKYEINYPDLEQDVDQISRMLDGLIRSMSR